MTASHDGYPDREPTVAFEPEDISFLAHFYDRLRQVKSGVADTGAKSAEIVRQIGAGFDHVAAQEAQGRSVDGVRLVLSAVSMGAAPSAEQSHAVADQLQRSPLLDAEQTRVLIELGDLTWRHRLNGMPDSRLALEVQDQVGYAISANRSMSEQTGQPEPLAYNTALMGFASGVSAGVPQMQTADELFRTMQAVGQAQQPPNA